MFRNFLRNENVHSEIGIQYIKGCFVFAIQSFEDAIQSFEDAI